MLSSKTPGKGSWRARPRRRAGVALILALVLLAVLTSVALVVAHVAVLSVEKSENLRRITDARLAGESGLKFMLYLLRGVRLPAGTTGTTFSENLCAALLEELYGTPNLRGQSIGYVSGGAFVPDIDVEDGKSFRCWVTWIGDNRC